MGLQERVYSVLIVSASETFHKSALDLLPSAVYQPIDIASDISLAKRRVASKEYDFVILNSPLPDDTGARFLIDCSRSRNTVILILCPGDLHDEIHETLTPYGVFTLAKPTNKAMFRQALSWMTATRERLRKLEKKASSLENRMEEIRVVNRAKWLLISELKMTEPEAHRHIEKNAMDNCISKKEAAENIVKLYS